MSSMYIYAEPFVTGPRVARGYWKWLLVLAPFTGFCFNSLWRVEQCLRNGLCTPTFFPKANRSTIPCCNALVPYLAGSQAESCLFSGKRAHKGRDLRNLNRGLSGEAERAEAGEIRAQRLPKSASELVSHSWQNSPSVLEGPLNHEAHYYTAPLLRTPADFNTGRRSAGN